MPPHVQRILQAFVIAAVVLSLFSLPGQAEDRESARCEAAIVAGARDSGVPQEVLHAISLTETGRRQGGVLKPWPWAINREGQGYWFETREEALQFARSSVAAGRKSFDVGCFQINYRWHGHHFTSLEAMFDPVTGAKYAGRFLSDLFAETGDWSRAAGSYHSRTPHYASVYRTRFDRIRASLGGVLLASVMPDEPEDAAEPRKSRTRMERAPLIINVRAELAGLAARDANGTDTAEADPGGSGATVLTVPASMRKAGRSPVPPGNGRAGGAEGWRPASSESTPEAPGPLDLPVGF